MKWRDLVRLFIAIAVMAIMDAISQSFGWTRQLADDRLANLVLAVSYVVLSAVREEREDG